MTHRYRRPRGAGTGNLLAARVLMSAVRAASGVVVPVYLAQLGHRALWIGTLFVAVGLVAAALSQAVGWWADRLGCKPFVCALPLLTGLAALGYAVSASPVMLVAAAAAGSFGRGAGAGSGTVGPYQPAEQAWLAALVPAARRHRLFAVFASGSAAGALLGSLLTLLPRVPGTAQLDGPAPYRTVFLVLAGLGVAAGLLALPVTEPRRSRPPADLARAGGSGAGAPATRRLSQAARGLLVRLWVTNGVNGIAVGFFGPFVSFWLHRRYGVSAGQIGALFAVINVVTMGTNLGADRLARRLGTVRAIVATRTLQGLLLIPMALMPTFLAAGAVYLARMAVQRLGLPLRQSYVIGLVEPTERARVTALSRLPSQLLSSTTPPLTGYLLQAVSLALPFTLAGVGQVVNAWLFWLFFRHIRADTDPAPPYRGPAGSPSPAGQEPSSEGDGPATARR